MHRVLFILWATSCWAADRIRCQAAPRDWPSSRPTDRRFVSVFQTLNLSMNWWMGFDYFFSERLSRYWNSGWGRRFERWLVGNDAKHGWNNGTILSEGLQRSNGKGIINFHWIHLSNYVISLMRTIFLACLWFGACSASAIQSRTHHFEEQKPLSLAANATKFLHQSNGHWNIDKRRSIGLYINT